MQFFYLVQQWSLLSVWVRKRRGRLGWTVLQLHMPNVLVFHFHKVVEEEVVEVGHGVKADEVVEDQ